MKLQKCRICGGVTAEIDNETTCLSCGRITIKEEPKKLPKPLLTIKTNERIAEQAHNNLLNNIDGALDYCLKRGITKHTINRWNLGYVPKNFTLLPTPWTQRILFPLHNADGTYIMGFGGRKITTDDRPKYLNSPSSALFHKGSSLYGLCHVPNNADVVYLCEGNVDVLSMDAKGYAYPVASLGTAFTKEQALIIRKKAKKVIICFDADEAGQKNTLKAIRHLLKAGFNAAEIGVFDITNAKDIDEALQKGGTITEYSLHDYLVKRGEYELCADTYL